MLTLAVVNNQLSGEGLVGGFVLFLVGGSCRVVVKECLQVYADQDAGF